ncbi:hypothetical protein [Nostoc sp.]|uniref:hypothetical protein n=1 Tax=Nostoc sp. TaxID=1180 RepID=UPI002FF826B8
MENNNTPQKQPEQSISKSEDHSQKEIAASTSSTSSEDQISDEEVIPTNVAEALKELPPAQRQIATSMFLSAEGRMSSSSSSSLLKHVTSEHITKTIENLEKENERDFKKNQASEVTKRLGMGAILVLVLMVFGYAGLTKDKDLAEKVIIAGISGLGGFGAGFAVSKKQS